MIIHLIFCLTAILSSCGTNYTLQHTETTQQVNIPEPVPPPTVIREAFDLDLFYQQWIDVEGLPVIASAKVNPYAVKEAAWLIRQMLQHRQDILQALVQNDVRFVVIAYNEMTTQIPEYENLKPNYYWDLRARGLGPREPISIVSCGEENLLNYPGDPYRAQNILIHEFSHAIHIMGLNTVDPSFDERLKEAFNLAKGKGLWRGTYAITNREEYWAEGTQSWFDTNWTDDSQHNHVRTREQLKAYDPALAALLTEVFGDTDWRYTRAINRTHLLHLQGFNLAKSPKFKWPSDFPDFTALHKQLLTQNSDGNGKWVNLQERDPSQIPNLKSEVNYTETAIIFVNRTEADIAYYWVDYKGNEIFYSRVAANSHICQNTHVGHFWIVKDMKGYNFSVFRASEKTGRAFVTMKPVDKPKTQTSADATDTHTQMLNPDYDGNGKWVNLQPIDLSLYPNLKSYKGESENAILFVNATKTGITYSWMDAVGNEIPYGKVASYDYVNQPTFAGYIWVVKDTEGKNLAIFRAVEKTGRALVTTKPQNK